MTTAADMQRALADKAVFEAYNPEDDAPSSWTEAYGAMQSLQVREENSNSASMAMINSYEERAKVIGELGGNADLAGPIYSTIPEPVLREWLEYDAAGNLEQAPSWQNAATAAHKSTDQWRQSYSLVREYSERFPDQVHSDAALFEKFKAEAAELRAKELPTIERGPGTAMLAGTMVGVAQDPSVLMTLPFGAGSAGGRTLLASALRVGAVEGSIAVATEIPIQAEVARFKRELEAPWTFKDSAVNVMSAGLGAAALGGTLTYGIGGLRSLRQKYKAAKDAGRVIPTDELEQADAILEATIELHMRDPSRIGDEDAIDFTSQAHERAYDKARFQHENGLPVDVADELPARIAAEGEEVLTRPEDPINAAIERMGDDAELESIDPRDIDIDPETFQYKSGTDAQGVNEALKGVQRFNRFQAGITLIWEQADGKRFVADGHQRRGLALRMLEAGQPEEEVKLNGFILREADGVTAGDARQIAAIKNLGSGNGSAIDAAKILREVGPAGRAMLPTLPPNSALVRQATGLSRLADDPFMQAVNDVVPQRFAALVGNATDDAATQGAMIEVLRKTKPANMTQAQAIVDQVKVQGIDVKKTEDLFGTQEIAESLYLERAQVLDAALRDARKDKAVFGRLLTDEGRITGAGGNVLDQTANMQRVQEARDATAKISALANAKGPISEALTEAARAVKGGAKPGAAAADFLETARREILAGNSRGAQAGREGAGNAPTANRPRVDPEVGRPVHMAELAEPDRVQALQRMIDKQMDADIAEIYRVADQHQKELKKIAAEITEEFGEDVVLADPGIKKRATAEDKLIRKNKKAGQLTDIVRLGFLVRTPAIAAEIIERLGRRVEVLDEGVATAGLGYVDHKALIRFADGKVGEVQLWDPAMAEAKFTRGEEIYAEVRSITVDELEADPARAATRDQLIEESIDLYVDAIARGNPEWRRAALQVLPEDIRARVIQAAADSPGSNGTRGNASRKASRDTSLPDSKTSKGSARDQAVSPSATEKPSVAPDMVPRNTAGMPSQLKNRTAIDAPPRSILRQIDTEKTPAPDITRTGTVNDMEYRAVMDRLNDLIDAEGELAHVSREVNGEIETRSAANVIDELENMETTLERIRVCSVAEETTE